MSGRRDCGTCGRPSMRCVSNDGVYWCPWCGSVVAGAFELEPGLLVRLDGFAYGSKVVRGELPRPKGTP